MVLGGDVPLTEDILLKQFDFVKTFFEKIAIEGLQILEFASGTGQADIYTVPINKVFYLISATIGLNGRFTASGSHPFRLSVRLSGNQKRIMHCGGIIGDIGDIVSNVSESQSFAPPLKFEENHIFFVDGGTGGGTFNHTGAIQGFEIDKRIVFKT